MHSRWPIWKIVLAYALMTMLAIASIWFVDRKVHLLPSDRPASPIKE